MPSDSLTPRQNRTLGRSLTAENAEVCLNNLLSSLCVLHDLRSGNQPSSISDGNATRRCRGEATFSTLTAQNFNSGCLATRPIALIVR